jgi:ubiquinone/menaquinone biosynthesis C-methylase UbiE
MVESAGT